MLVTGLSWATYLGQVTLATYVPSSSSIYLTSLTGPRAFYRIGVERRFPIPASCHRLLRSDQHHWNWNGRVLYLPCVQGRLEGTSNVLSLLDSG
jgi:hypothetical protein